MDLVVITIIMLAGAAVFLHSMFVGAPFLPSKYEYIEKGLDLLGMQKGQRLLDLGSGDGRVLIVAARRGIHATGYEINPLLFTWSWLRTRRYREYASLKLGSYWDAPLPEADGIYVYLLKPYMKRLDNKLSKDIRRPVKVLSFVYYIPGKEPVATATGMYMYEYGA